MFSCQVCHSIFIFAYSRNLAPDGESHPAFSANVKQKLCFLDRIGPVPIFDNHGVRKRQVGLGAKVDEIIIDLKG